jgi:hypothetical protein
MNPLAVTFTSRFLRITGAVWLLNKVSRFFRAPCCHNNSESAASARIVSPPTTHGWKPGLAMGLFSRGIIT